VRPGWEALAARARGLGTHLLDDAHVSRLERAGSLSALAQQLEDTIYARFLPPRASSAASLETGITRSLAERLRTLERWSGERGRLLGVVFLEQDMHNVRALLRGAVGGLGPEQRLEGTVPTPALPRKALAVLARAETPAAVAATLTAWGHPLGKALLSEGAKGPSDPFHMEVALARGFAAEARRRSLEGGLHIRHFVADSLDASNAETALLLAGSRSEGSDEELFLEGGRHLSREGFMRAVAAEGRPAAATALAEELRGTPFGEPFAGATASPATLSVALASARIASLRAAARLDPVSALPVLLFVLSLREEGRRLRRAVWRVSLARGSGA